MDERVVAGLARQEIIEGRQMSTALSFEQDEAGLRRPVGGRMVLRRRLERLLEVGRMRKVENGYVRWMPRTTAVSMVPSTCCGSGKAPPWDTATSSSSAA
ncbi:Scr1 family TA system antitoxin-like transcriptional regulator [Streptomyces capillispiralis]|uniref:Scr1 family TA system antitoxin-like transcriptional regulator n=1 Tax=Streptomyces capillispiralis TaxID=68182 RepID=UPI0036898E20